MDYLFYGLSIAAVMTISIARYRLERLRRRVTGGVVRTKFNIMGEFMSLFALALLSFSFLPLMTDEGRNIIAGVVFIFAGVFAIVVVNLFSTIADEIGL